MCRTARCCCWPTSSWTRCRSANSSRRGEGWAERFVEDGRFRCGARPADRAARPIGRAIDGDLRAGPRPGGAMLGARSPATAARRCSSTTARSRPRPRATAAGAARGAGRPAGRTRQADLTAHVDFPALAAAARSGRRRRARAGAAGSVPRPPRPVPATPTAWPAASPAARGGADGRGRSAWPSPTAWGGCSRRWRSATPPALPPGFRGMTARHPDQPRPARPPRLLHPGRRRVRGPYASLNCSLSGARPPGRGAGKPRPGRAQRSDAGLGRAASG